MKARATFAENRRFPHVNQFHVTSSAGTAPDRYCQSEVASVAGPRLSRTAIIRTKWIPSVITRSSVAFCVPFKGCDTRNMK